MKKCFIIVSWVASYKKGVQVQLYFRKIFKNETLLIGGSEIGNHFFFLQKMRMNFIKQRIFFRDLWKFLCAKASSSPSANILEEAEADGPMKSTQDQDHRSYTTNSNISNKHYRISDGQMKSTTDKGYRKYQIFLIF